MKHLFCIFIAISLQFNALAQEIHQEDGDHHHDSIIHLGPIDVLGEFGQSDLLSTVPTVSNLHGEDLLRKAEGSLGETLNQETGVNSSQFGPAASRPVIRGLEGDRIRILQNGIGVLDASGTSQDHAVPINPLSVESIEVVRGPINLLYGSSAIGGVVNIVNSRIHKNYYEGLYGGLDLKSESVTQGQNFSAKVDYGVNNFMFHLDGNYLNAKNTQTPLGEMKNSEMEQHSFAVGTTFFTQSKNYLGVSYSRFKNLYGIVSEEEVDIDLQQDRIDLSGYYKLEGFFKAIQLKSAQTFYKHTELEGSEIGTVFENTGNETRIELIQQNSPSLSGMLGLQTQILELSALGEEAFLPTTDSKNIALFIFEEIKLNSWKFNTGVRGEWTQLSTQDLNFFNTSQTNDFLTASAAFGGRYLLTPRHSTTFNVSYNERAPTYQELYSNGAHLAIGIFERGDINLAKEESIALEWSFKHQTKKTTSLITLFNQEFTNYIAQNPTGQFADTDDTPGLSPDDFEIYNYSAQKARINGIEAEFQYKLTPSLKTKIQGDYLYGQNLETNTPLPRISPLRVGMTFQYSRNSWQSHLEWRHVSKQTRTTTNETSTPSYDLINLGANYQFKLNQESMLSIYGQVKNIADIKARNHVSVIKEQVLLPGRNFILGARLIF